MKVANMLVEEISDSLPRTLSPTAKRVLRAVMVSGFMSFKDIYRVCLEGQNKGNAHHLIRNLERQGHLEALFNPGGGIIGWRLSRPHLKRFAQIVQFPIASQYRFVAGNLNHDILVRKVARQMNHILNPDWIAFESLIRARQMSEGRRRRSKEMSVPDLLIRYQSPQSTTTVAFEVELTQKNKARIERILENRMTSDHWSKVIYLLGPGLKPRNFQEMIRYLKVTSPKVGFTENPHRLYFFPLKEVLLSGVKATGEDEIQNPVSLNDALHTG